MWKSAVFNFSVMLRAAAALPVHDEALDPVRAAQRRGRGDHVPGADAGPHIGGADGDLVRSRHQGDPVHGEAEPGTQLPQQVDRTGAAVTEPEVLPHHHVRGVQPVDQRVAPAFVGAADFAEKKATLEQLRAKVQEVVLFGASREHFEKAWQGIVPISWHETMEPAVRFATANAASGDVVLLAPATSSYDLYKNYEQRGDDFKRIVGLLP